MQELQNTTELQPKFPDPLDTIDEQQLDQLVLQSPPPPPSNKKMIRNAIIFLVVLPISAGIIAFSYNTYQDYRLRRLAEQRVIPQVDFSNIQPQEPFPSASLSGQLNPNSKRYTNATVGFSVLYPPGWFVRESARDGYRLQSFDPATAAEREYDPTSDAGRQLIAISEVKTDTPIDSVKDLEDFVKALTASSSANASVVDGALKVNGFSAVKRKITQPGTQKLLPEAYIIDGKGQMFRMVADYDVSNVEGVFDEILASFQFTDGNDPSLWKIYQNQRGYSVRNPDEWVLVEGDVSNSTQSAGVDARQVSLYLQREKELEGGIKNYLKITFSETEPNQSATQSATKDLGGQTLREYDYPSGKAYVLYGENKFIEFLMTYDTNIERRNVLEKIVETVRFD